MPPSSFPRRGARTRWLKTCILSLSVVLGGLAPAYAGSGHIQSTRSIDAPAGFQGVCDRYAWACARASTASQTMDDAALLRLARKVNGQINRRVREVSDLQQYRVAEHWALPTAHGGDCEDFALLKKRELIRHGVSPDRLLIATVLTAKREAHAVLILRTAAGDVVLDNLTNKIKPWAKTGYGFLRMQDPRAPARWQMVLAGGMFGAGRG